MNFGSLLRRSFATASILTVLGLSTAFGQERSEVATPFTNYGDHLIETQSGLPLEGVIATWTPIDLPGDSMPDPYTFMTDADGWYPWEVLYEYDSIYVGQQENKLEQIATNVFPQPSKTPTVNFEANEKPGKMYIYNENSSLIAIINGPNEYRDGKAGYHLKCLEYEAEGMYIFKAKTSEGVASGKIMRVGYTQTPYLGIKTIPKDETESEGHKFGRTNEVAIYEIKLEKEGYTTKTYEVELEVGPNGLLYDELEEGNGDIPQYQRLGGYTWNLAGNKLAGVIIEMYNRANDQFIESDTSNSSGYYEFEYPVAAGTDIYFKASKNEDYRYLDASTNDDDTYEVPNVIEQENDTINQNLYVVMFPVDLPLPAGGTASPSSEQIVAMFGNLNVEMSLHNLKFWLNPNINETIKEAYRTNATNFGNMIGHPGIMVESSVKLNQDLNGYDPYTNPKPVGINVEYGSNNTDPDYWNVTNPLGNNLTPVFSAETTINGTSADEHDHETYQAMGGDITSGYGGIGDSEGLPATTNDKAILNAVATYGKLLFEDGKAYFLELGSLTDEQNQPRSAFPHKDITIPSVEYKSDISY